jgi:NAD(P)-dependent dehydrogenase (short-subunit alcohol dehydrogenase family)
MNQYFAGKVIAITGAASGMGLATAKRLASYGALISLADINSARLRQVHLDIKEEYGDCVISRDVDIREPKKIEEWIEYTASKFGKLDGAANFAGTVAQDFLDHSIENINSESWKYVIDVNLTGTMNCVRTQTPYMKSGGAIINTSSIIGMQGGTMVADYCASKFGVIGLSKCAAKELVKLSCKVIRYNRVTTDKLPLGSHRKASVSM